MLCDDINNSILNNQKEFSHLCGNDSVLLYNCTLINILNKHCPLIEKRYDTSRQTSPWYNLELQKLKQERRRKERKFKKHPSPQNLYNLKEARNNYNNNLKKIRSQCSSIKRKFNSQHPTQKISLELWEDFKERRKRKYFRLSTLNKMLLKL